MTEPEIMPRNPTSFEDCLIVLRKDGCIACARRNERFGNWETCRIRVGLKYNGEGVPAYR